MPATLSHLECSACGEHLNANELQNLCPVCGSPLLARYDLAKVKASITPQQIEDRPRMGIWRWQELLPVSDPQYMITLGEGDTPLLHMPRLGQRVGLDHLYIKDEGVNPTGSFKARGMAAGVSRGWELGAKAFVTPTAGNAGGAMAAYAAHAGLQAHVFMPKDAPMTNQIETQIYGAQLILVEGLINDAGRPPPPVQEKRLVRDDHAERTLPHRRQEDNGTRTGDPLQENGQWKLPDVILYPTGGGVGLIGMWKAFDEMEQLGWIGSERPRLVVVQSDGCAPIVKAYQQGALASEIWQNARTIASGLRIPAVRGDRLILRALRETNGTAIAVSDDEILEAQWLVARLGGVFAAPEGAACYAAVIKLVESGWIQADEKVLIYNTGSGMKYNEILPKPVI
ncbi:MAG: threonine synthase [Anaerolineae bacterium]